MSHGPIILAAGGTGGHMFPAEALARELLDRGQPVVLVTDIRGKAFGDALPAVRVERIRSATASISACMSAPPGRRSTEAPCSLSSSTLQDMR